MSAVSCVVLISWRWDGSDLGTDNNNQRVAVRVVQRPRGVKKKR